MHTIYAAIKPAKRTKQQQHLFLNKITQYLTFS